MVVGENTERGDLVAAADVCHMIAQNFFNVFFLTLYRRLGCADIEDQKDLEIDHHRKYFLRNILFLLYI